MEVNAIGGLGRRLRKIRPHPVAWATLAWALLAVTATRLDLLNGTVYGHNWDWSLPALSSYYPNILAQASSLWREYGTGQPVGYGLSSAPYGLAIGALGLVLSPSILSKLIVIATIIVAGVGAFAYLYAELRPRGTPTVAVVTGACVGSLLFGLSPFLFNEIVGGAITQFLSWCFVPLVLLQARKLPASPLFSWRSLRFALTMLWISISLHTLVLTVGLLGLHFMHRLGMRAGARAFGRALLLHAAVSLWWILPLIMGSLVPRGLAAPGQTFSIEGLQTGAPDLLGAATLAGYFRPLVLLSMTESARTTWLALAVLVPAFVLVANLVWPRSREGAFWAGLFTLSLPFATGANPPLGNAVLWLYQNFPPMILFRSVQHLLLVPALALALGAGFGVHAVLERAGDLRSARARWGATIVVVLLSVPVATMALPTLSGDFGREGLLRVGPGNFLDAYHTDPELETQLDWIARTPGEFRVLFVPTVGSPLYLDTPFQRSAQGGDPLIISSPHPGLATDVAISPSSAWLVERVALDAVRPAEGADRFAETARLLGIRYVVLREDVRPNFGALVGAFQHENAAARLANATGLRLLHAGEAVMIWEVEDAWPTAYIAAGVEPRDLRIHLSSNETLSTLAGPTAWVAGAGGAEGLGSVWQIAAHHYVVEVEHPGWFVLGQGYDERWTLYEGRPSLVARLFGASRVEGPVLANGYANAWLLPDDAAGRTFTLHFASQDHAALGLTATSVLVAVGTIVALRRPSQSVAPPLARAPCRWRIAGILGPGRMLVLLGAGLFVLAAWARLSWPGPFWSAVLVAAFWVVVVGILLIAASGRRGAPHPAPARRWRFPARLHLRWPRSPRLLVPAYYIGLALLVGWPLLRPGYVLALDWVGGPELNPLETLTGEILFEGPALLPLGLFAAISDLLGGDLASRALLLCSLVAMGLGAHRLCPTPSLAGRLFAGTLYVANPFVYVRLVSGQWLSHVALAALPFCALAFLAVLDGRRRSLLPLALLTTLAFIQIQYVVVLGLLYAGLLLWKLRGARWSEAGRIVGRAGLAGLAIAAVGSYWVVSYFAQGSPGLALVGAADLSTFRPRAETEWGVAFELLSLYGFWREGYVLPLHDFAAWWLFAPFVVLLCAVALASRPRDPFLIPLATCGALAWGYVAFTSLPVFEGTYTWLWERSALVRLLRDSHKLLALLLLAYAVVGGAGLARVVKQRPGRAGAAVTAAGLAFVAVCAAPLFIGYHGQLVPSEPPADWEEVRARMDAVDPDAAALYLPWHLYMDHHWVGSGQKRIAAPARAYFDRPILQGDSAGTHGSESQDPVSAYVRTVLAEAGDRTDLGDRLAPLGVRFVVLAKEVEWSSSAETLARQPDLALAMDGPTLQLYENLASVAPAYVIESDGLKPLEARRGIGRVEVDAPPGARIVLAVGQGSAPWRWEGMPAPPDYLGILPTADADGPGAFTNDRFWRVLVPGYALSAAAVLGLALAGWLPVHPRDDRDPGEEGDGAGRHRRKEHLSQAPVEEPDQGRL